jgi:hypothetical protein
VLGVVGRECPTRMVGRKLGVANSVHVLTPHRISLISNGEQGEGNALEDRQVALTELHEGLVGSPLQSVIEVVAPSRCEPSRHGRVSGAHGPCSAQDQTDGTDNHGIWGSPCSQNGVARPGAR